MQTTTEVDGVPYTLSPKAPTAREFIELRVAIGWPAVEEKTAERAVNRSLYAVSVYNPRITCRACAGCRRRTLLIRRIREGSHCWLFVHSPRELIHHSENPEPASIGYAGKSNGVKPTCGLAPLGPDPAPSRPSLPCRGNWAVIMVLYGFVVTCGFVCRSTPEQF